MASEEHRAPAGAGKFVLLSVGLFVLAIVAARVILDRTWGWGAALLAIPILVVAVRFAVGWVGAVVLVGFFASVVLFLRAILANPKVGPAIVLLIGAFALSALLAGRVAIGLWWLRRQKKNTIRVREGEGD